MTSSVDDDGTDPRDFAVADALTNDAKSPAEAGFEAGLCVAVDAFSNMALVLDRTCRVVASNAAFGDFAHCLKDADLQREMGAVMAVAEQSCSPACVDLDLGDDILRRFHVTSLTGRNGVDVRFFLVTEDTDGQTPIGPPPLLTYELASGPMRALREEAARFKRLSETDPLTGTLNIRTFADHVTRVLTDRPRMTGAMICLDLNRFKMINDRYGHVAGDKVLIHVASKLNFPAHTGILTARMGGDEFALWMPGVTMGSLASVVDSLRMRLSVPVDLSSDQERRLTITVKASIGAVCCPNEALNYTSLRHLADQRLYEDKANWTRQQGRGGYQGSPKRKGAVDPAPQSFLPR